MTLKTQIKDGTGTGASAKVCDENALWTHQLPYPPLTPQRTKIFSQFLTDDGTPTGSNDLGITGAVTPVEFWVPSDNTTDLYITKLSIIIGYGTSAPLYEFADSGGVLANGVKIDYEDSVGDIIEIINATVNYDFIRFAQTNGTVPGSSTAGTGWQLRNLGASNDYGYMLSLDLSSMMPPHGIKIDRGTTQKLKLTIRDDCTDADIFNCKAFGFQRF